MLRIFHKKNKRYSYSHKLDRSEPKMSDIAAKQKIEIEYWRDSEHESPEADSIPNIINKISDAEVFLACLNRHKKELITNGRVLELGAGQSTK